MTKQPNSVSRRWSSKLFHLLQRRGVRRRQQRAALRLECLERRMMLHAGHPEHDGEGETNPSYNPNSDFHIHYDLHIYVNGQKTVIPAKVGDTVGIHTHDETGKIHVHPGPRSTFVTLGEFFNAWRTDPDAAERNPNATLNANQLFNNTVDNQNSLQMFVNGERNSEFENYKVDDGDVVVLVYGSNPVVTLQTNYGDIPVELFPQQAPITVNNFLNYVNDGDYVSSIFHRYVPGFVLQGGGFRTTSPTFTSSAQLSAIPTDPQIQNEFGIPNTAGTISMAKLGGQVNSATSQFFINLGDNRGNLDNQNGGFTVFARILDPSIIADAAQLTRTNAGGVFNELPLFNTNQLVTLEAVTGDGTVRGFSFRDADGDGIRDTGEAGLAGVTVFSDDNGNGVRDGSEVFDVTDANGAYALDLPAGQHVIRQQPPSGLIQTSPQSPGTHTVIVQVGRDVNDINFGNSQAVVGYRYEITDPSGAALSGPIDVGDEFLVRVYVKDLRTTAPQNNFGVFAAYQDMDYDESRVSPVGSITFVQPYVNGQSGSTATTGLIDEVGSFVNSLSATGNDEFLQYTVRFRAISSGTATFRGDAPEVVPSHQILVFGQGAPVPFDQVVYGNTSISINASTDPRNDVFNFDEDSTGNVMDVLANDGPAGTIPNLTISTVTQPANGTVTISADKKRLTYTPGANFFGEVSFTYTATDGGTPYTAMAVVQVFPKNDQPDAIDDTFTVNQGTSNNLLDVLGNDLIAPDQNDPQEVLRVLSVTATSAQGGTVTRGSSGTHVLYTPRANFRGVDTFTYTANDRQNGDGLSDTATVTVTVTAVNENPLAVGDTLTVAEDSSNHEIDVLANDSTGSDTGETLSLTGITQGGQGGAVSIKSGNQRVIYTPKANFFGVETFTYTISDGNGGTAVGTVTATVTNVNDPPTAVNDTATVTKDAPATIDVLQNDTSSPDPSEVLTITQVTQGSHGTVTIVSGKVQYQPAAGYKGADSFTYTISDGNGGTATGTVTVDVRDFVPSHISGSVFLDGNGNGIRDAGESPLGGVTVRLEGTDSFGVAVRRTQATAVDGSYSFRDLTPGDYTVIQEQPAFLLDGKDTAGPLGGTLEGNDRIRIQLAQNVNAVANNFAEQGRQASFIGIRDLFASTPRESILAVINRTNGSQWAALGNGWETVRTAQIELLPQSSALKLDITENGTNLQYSAAIEAEPRKVQVLGSAGDDRLVRILGPRSSYNFAPVTSSASSTAQAAASGTQPAAEGEAPESFRYSSQGEGEAPVTIYAAGDEANASVVLADAGLPATYDASADTVAALDHVYEEWQGTAREDEQPDLAWLYAQPHAAQASAVDLALSE